MKFKQGAGTLLLQIDYFILSGYVCGVWTICENKSSVGFSMHSNGRHYLAKQVYNPHPCSPLLSFQF